MPKVSKLGILISQKEDKNAYQRAYRALHPELEKKYRNKEKTREASWLRLYGITREDYEKFLLSQNGKCAICNTSQIGRGHSYFHVDHNHSTGKVRGLLCDKCNRGLGYFNDSSSILTRASNYLNENN